MMCGAEIIEKCGESRGRGRGMAADGIYEQVAIEAKYSYVLGKCQAVQSRWESATAE